MSLFTRVLDTFRGKAAEGAYRPGPYLLHDGSWLPAGIGQYANFWQMGYNAQPFGAGSAMVEACVSAYAQTLAMCPLNHWRDQDNGGRVRVTNSALSRVMRAPNDYQTSSDFVLNAVRSLYLEGNAYALALRNDRFEVASLHLMHPHRCKAEVIEGEVYYALGGNCVIDSRLTALDYAPLSYVPARDVFHVKLQTPRDVLRGETPLTAAALAVAANNAMMSQAIAFYQNQSRPSGVLQTDLVLTPAQVTELRGRWDEQAKGLAAGGTPILTSGLKFEPISVSQADAQFAEAMKLSDQQIAEVFRVPLAIIGSEAQPMGSTEALMAFWIGGGLGFALNQVELAVDKLFGLAKIDGEYSELDTEVLMRSAFKDRIDALARAVQGGIYSPNEARAKESLPAAKDGDEPRVQQQVVPLSAWDKALTKPAPAAPPAPAGNDNQANQDQAELAGKMLDGLTCVVAGLATLHEKTDALHDKADAARAVSISLREAIDEYGNVIRLMPAPERGPIGEPGPPGERGEKGDSGEPGYGGRACGLYNAAEAYRAMDVVSFNGSEWRAIVDDPGVLPGPGWMLGAKGSRGKRGERGPPGPPTVVKLDPDGVTA